MTYEFVDMPAKTVVGLAARTNNHDPQMGPTIGGLWQQLWGGLYEQIGQKTDSHTIGLYSDYADGVDGD